MTLEVFSLVVLLIMFVVASVLPINLGIMGFVAAFVVGALLGGMTVDDIFGVFPGDLFILLAGVTFLFAIAQNNGTVDLLMNWGVRLVRGNVGLVPWIMFTLTTLVTGVGALSSAGVAIVAPVALRSASQYRINPLLMGIMVVAGATAGSYSPISPFGIITNGVLASRDLPQNPGLLFANCLIFNAVIAALVFLAFGGLRLLRRRITLEEAASEVEKSEEGALTPYRAATLAGIVILAVSAFAFGSSDRFDIGFAAFVIGLVLVLVAPREQSAALGRMPWSAILLICGILTYVGVLDQIGTIEYMQDLIAGVGNPIVAALAASYVGGIISAFASTAAVLGASIPLAEPILQGSGLSAIGVITSIAISSAIVDISPLSTNGALLIANAQDVDERKFFRQLLAWAVGVVIFAPFLAWLVFVVIGIP
jgi:Na+/H+ antiporter NhaD/arsenite permease-like protein